MNDFGAVLKAGVEAALEAQGARAEGTVADARARVVRRGRRRRAGRVALAVGLSGAVVAGAASATEALLRGRTEVAAPDVPEMGAERAFSGFGRAITSDGRSLWVGSGATSNTRGDRNGITRVDLTTEQSVDGPPAVLIPHAMAAGDTGVWSVSWSGDLPLGGAGSPVRGAIERVDPLTLERTGHIPLEDSAPEDVAVGRVGGEEVAWVVDSGRGELVRVDAGSMEIGAVYEIVEEPGSVNVHGRYVYVTSSEDHVVARMDAETEEVVRFDVPECANDVAIAEGSLWVTDFCGDALLRIDEDGSEETVSIPISEASAIEYAEGLLWVGSGQSVVRVHPASNTVVGNAIYVSELRVEDLLYAGGSMWAGAMDGVYRLAEDVPPATPTPTPPPTPDPGDVALADGVTRVGIERDPRALATGAGSVWTGLFEIQRLDEVSGGVLAQVDPGGIVQSMDFDEAAGVLWAFVEVAEKETNAVVAVDPGTDRVVLGPVLLDRPGLNGGAMAAYDGVAWVAGDRTVSRVDLTGDVAEIDVGDLFGHPGDTSGFNVAATSSAVFVVPGNGDVVRIDPQTFETEKVGDLGWNVGGTVSDGETVWVVQTTAATSEILLWTLDGASGEPVGAPVAVGEFGDDHIAQHDGLVWVGHSGLRRESATMKAYEGGRGEPVVSVEVPNAPFVQGVAAGPEGLWMTTGHDFLYRIAPD